jgi:hypothetical protein
MASQVSPSLLNTPLNVKTKKRYLLMSSIQATPEETTQFLKLLERISKEQLIICERLDELVLLMQMPSENVLEVLEGLLIPMGVDLSRIHTDFQTTLTSLVAETPKE